VSLLCDGGERYGPTYYNDEWLAAQGLDIRPRREALDEFFRTGVLR
jgi:cysteine synthase A